jgi:plasmid stabilization system protein ParE
MAREIVWTKRAAKKFDNIIKYLETEWSGNIARDFVIRTYAVIELLSVYSEMGTLEVPDKGIRGFVLIRHNTLFYRATESQLTILNIFDNRKKPG